MSDFAVDVHDYEGVRVVCDWDRWQLKIEDNHPELSGWESDVARAISDPALVLQDRDFVNRKHHIRKQRNGLFLDVGVEYRQKPGGLPGHLVTAFVRQRLRSGDSVLYVARLKR